MNISEKGLNLVKEFEGCYLNAYKCPAGVWTIGYGHTGSVDNKKIVLRYAPSGLAFVSGTTVKPYGGGASGATVYSTIIYGQDAFGTVSFGGSGENIEIIMNPPGSSGALDPLKQRGTIAWKVKGFCSVILQDAFIVRVEHGATA